MFVSRLSNSHLIISQQQAVIAVCTSLVLIPNILFAIGTVPVTWWLLALTYFGGDLLLTLTRAPTIPCLRKKKKRTSDYGAVNLNLRSSVT